MTDRSSVCIMDTPPVWSTVRVNTLKLSIDEAKQRMEAILDNQYHKRKRDPDRPNATVRSHPNVPDLLLIEGSGPYAVEPVDNEIYVDVDCGCAVMRGADIYAPGVLGSNGYFAVGDLVSVYADMDGQCKRGLKQPYIGNRVFLGNGIAKFSRNEIFSSTNVDGKSVTGIGVLMTGGIWDNPSLDGSVIEDWGFVQNLPSVVCGHVLDPQPGEIVLDMCAAPGGKSTHLATLMKDQGRVISIDSSSNRIQDLIKNANALSLMSVEAYRMDALDLLTHPVSPGKTSLNTPTFPPGSFDRVLLDAPCSCTGQRPHLKKLTDKQRTSHVPLQRKLLMAAYHLLRRGGTMVYSTCSLEVEENENQIAWFLSEHPDMTLSAQRPFIGQEVKIANDKASVQKFDPRLLCNIVNTEGTKHNCRNEKPGASQISFSYDQDTIGFFIAKMIKS